MAERTLIVNADDFGRSPGVNRGVIRAHEHGIVTSAALMVRWPAAEEAASYGRHHPTLSVGLHLDLGEWQYRDGHWRTRYQVIEASSEEAATEEIERQLQRFEALMGRAPTHLDSHQHVHREDPVRTALLRLARRLDVPVRGLTPEIGYLGFHGHDAEGTSLPDAITVDALVETIDDLPAGITELGCHPAEEADHESAYGEERLRELETLCDPRVLARLDRNEVVLRSFGDLSGPFWARPA